MESRHSVRNVIASRDDVVNDLFRLTGGTSSSAARSRLKQSAGMQGEECFREGVGPTEAPEVVVLCG